MMYHAHTHTRAHAHEISDTVPITHTCIYDMCNVKLHGLSRDLLVVIKVEEERERETHRPDVS